MTDVKKRIDAIWEAITEGSSPTASIEGSAIVCEFANMVMTLSADEAEAIAISFEKESRKPGFEGDDVKDWLVSLRRCAMRLRNTTSS